MGAKLSPQDMELYQRVDEVLYYVWDPIGVSKIPVARDEYVGYLPHLFSLLKEGASLHVIAAHLDGLVLGKMGLSSNLGHSSTVAAVLIEWREVIANKLAAS